MSEEGLRVRHIINDDFHTTVLFHFHFKSGRLENGGLAPGEYLWIRPVFRQTEKTALGLRWRSPIQSSSNGVIVVA